MKRIFCIGLLILFFMCTPIQAQEIYEETLEGKVIEITEQKQVTYNDTQQTYQKLKVEIINGSLKNNVVTIENGQYAMSNELIFKTGDQVTISSTKDGEGNKIFYITDFIRRDGLLVLFILFIALAILIGKFRGALSLFGMVISFVIIFKLVLPLILQGFNAVAAAILGAILIIPLTFSLSHGLNRKTVIAIFGTIITLITIGILATIFVNITKLTGFAAEEAGFLQFQVGIINMRGILLAGIIISSLGILDDITISQASIVAELKAANPKLSRNELFVRAMNVGRDHIASLVNTLILVYTGASLPLLLLFINNPHPFSEVINYEIVADEVVRTLVDSIGLILAVPITTFLAAFYWRKNQT